MNLKNELATATQSMFSNSFDRRRVKQSITKLTTYLVLASTLVFIVLPILWVLLTSLRPSGALQTSEPALISGTFTLTQYDDVIIGTLFSQWYANSVIMAVGVVMLTTVTSTLGGYGLSRLEFGYKEFFSRFILIGYMFPPIMLAIPIFIIWRNLNMVNTYTGMVFAQTAIALPFSLWLMWKFFDSVPYRYEECAQMCGASRFRAFYEAALPQAKPGVIAIAIFSFAISWNEYTLPRILLSERTMWPLTIGVHSFTQENQIIWGKVMAASFLMIIPPLLFVYFAQKYLMEGFRVGSL